MQNFAESNLAFVRSHWRANGSTLEFIKIISSMSGIFCQLLHLLNYLINIIAKQSTIVEVSFSGFLKTFNTFWLRSTPLAMYTLFYVVIDYYIDLCFNLMEVSCSFINICNLVKITLVFPCVDWSIFMISTCFFFPIWRLMFHNWDNTKKVWVPFAIFVHSSNFEIYQ